MDSSHRFLACSVFSVMLVSVRLQGGTGDKNMAAGAADSFVLVGHVRLKFLL
jgi:hypothetical protein